MIGADKIEEELKNAKIREGSLLKRSKFLKEWRKRWIVLTSSYLISFTSENCKEVTDILDVRTLKSYKSYMAKAEEMIPASFKMRTGDTAFYLCAANVEEKWSWIVSLERLIDFKTCGASSYNNL